MASEVMAGDAASGMVAPFKITVAEPIKNKDGALNSYMSYKVRTETTLEEFDYKDFSAIRRYSDFVWLRGTLLKLMPGTILPPLPEKAVMNRFAPEFVEGRRRSLQRFLNRCAEHPIVNANELFRKFLSEDALASLKTLAADLLAAANPGLKATTSAEGASASAPSGGGTAASASAAAAAAAASTGRFLSSMMSAATASTPALPKSEDDLKIEEITAYANNLEAQMLNVSKHTAILVKRGRDLSKGLFEFGLAFTMLGEHETEVLTGAMAQMGHTADQLSLIAAEQVDKEQLSFEEPILDYIQMLHALKEAINSRQQVRKTYQGAIGDKESKQHMVQRLKDANPVNEAKVEAAEQDLIAAEAYEKAMQQKLGEVTARTFEEVERFKTTKAEDMRKVVLDYVQLQIEYNKRMEEQWASLLPEIESIKTESPLPASFNAAGASAGVGAAAPPPAPSQGALGAAEETVVGV